MILKIFFIFFSYGQSRPLSFPPSGELFVPSGEKIVTFIAIKKSEQIQGLSGVYENEFKKTQGLLFSYPDLKKRQFWMPYTFFDLHIIFLDSSFKIIEIEKLKHNSSNKIDLSQIDFSRPILSRHVLEIRSDSPITKILKKGMQLKWSSFSPLEKEREIHLQQ